MADLPDLEQLLSAYYRSVDEVEEFFDDRVYTILPKGHDVWPTARLTRVGGEPVTNYPLHLDRARIQHDVWGGPRSRAHAGAQLLRRVLLDAVGAHETGVITGVEFGSLMRLPDQIFTPARERYLFDAVVYAHPA